MSNEDEDIEELKKYREQVVAEVVRRAEVVKGFDSEISSAEFVIEAEQGRTRMLLGNTMRVQQREAFKATLQKRRDDLQMKRVQAGQDLKRAEERLADVEARISRLLNAQGGVIGLITEGK